jgi:hypothetical protein
MARYILLPLPEEAGDLAELAFDHLRESIPDWEPSEGNLETILLEAFAQVVADLHASLTGVPAEIFRYFGRTLAGVPPHDATLATGTVTFTRPGAGAELAGEYVVPADTVIAGAAPDGELVSFRTVADAPIPAGAASIAGVPVEALDEGTGGNGVVGVGELVDPLDLEVDFAALTTGGQDREPDDAYLDRLADELRLMAPRPILAGDFATLARRVDGVARCLALDGLNPTVTPATTGNERMVTVAPVDDDGNPVSAATRAAVQAYLDALREVNFVVHVIEPTYTTVAVNFTATAWPGWDPVAVQAAAIAAVQDYLSPAHWGQAPGGDVREWLPNETTVSHYEVAEALNRVDGLRRVTALTLNGQANAEIALTGYAPLPRAGAITGTVTAS